MEYTVVIRTLGKAGEKYQQMLNSLLAQTIVPKEIIVYLAEGYTIPKETIGIEKYVYVPKGMVAQRALYYEDVDTEYILFLDDDVYLPETSVEQMYNYLIEYDADVISPDVFLNENRPFKARMLMFLFGRMIARKDDGKWGYKVMRNAGYSYNNNPTKNVYWSQTNAGPCFFCSKRNFLKIHYEEELWLDRLKYALGEDQVMFYKMYKYGLKQLTWFHSGIQHLDAGTTLLSLNKSRDLVYSDFYFKTVFWHRFIFLPEKTFLLRLWDIVCICYTFFFALLVSLVKGKFEMFRIRCQAICDACRFIRSESYRMLPLIK